MSLRSKKEITEKQFSGSCAKVSERGYKGKSLKMKVDP